MYSVFGWIALYISVKFICSSVSLNASVSLLSFCMDDLSLNVSVKVPCYYFVTVSLCLLILAFLYLGAPMWGVYVFTFVISSYWIDPLIVM